MHSRYSQPSTQALGVAPAIEPRLLIGQQCCIDGYSRISSPRARCSRPLVTPRGAAVQAKDYAIAPRPGHDGLPLVLHRVDCPTVRAQAAAGEPVMTMLGCKREPGQEMERCSCLKGE